MVGATRTTRVTVDGEQFSIDGEPTYRGQRFDGHSIEGLLFNVRTVQALFDDDNPDTVDRWTYPDTGEWDPERNLAEFLDAMPTYYDHGVRAVGINLQCGRPVRNIHEGGTDPAAREQPWVMSAFRSDGALKPDRLDRLERVLEAADELGMVVILGLFYQGQDDLLSGETSVRAGIENAVEWLFDHEFTNVLIEVTNECDTSYDHEILGPERVHELIESVADLERDGYRYPVSTSFGGGSIPTDAVIEASDFVLLHGNGVDDPDRITEMIEEVRGRPSYDPMPVVFNEDDVAMLHGPADGFSFGPEPNHLSAAIEQYASWGYYDKGENNYRDGFQCPPVDWGVSTDRKAAFFDYLEEITTAEP